MKKNKVYKIKVLDIITSLAIHIVVIFSIILLLIFIINERTSLNVMIAFSSFAIFIVSCYGIYPIYLCWNYYQREKNITIYIDYEKSDLQYLKNGIVIFNVKFDDIVLVEEHRRFRTTLWYYKIILKNNDFIIITSLLISNIYRAIPNIRSKTENERGLFLPPRS